MLHSVLQPLCLRTDQRFIGPTTPVTEVSSIITSGLTARRARARARVTTRTRARGRARVRAKAKAKTSTIRRIVTGHVWVAKGSHRAVN